MLQGGFPGLLYLQPCPGQRSDPWLGSGRRGLQVTQDAQRHSAVTFPREPSGQDCV